MDQEVEEVSFLPGEAILNKKSVYEPTKGQRFRQVVCSRGWAICILMTMGIVMISISVIAAFARPASCNAPAVSDSPDSASSMTEHEVVQTYISTDGQQFPWRNLRLPRTILPEAYNIFMHANLSESYFLGRVQMTLRVVESTDFIVFHALNLNVSEIRLVEGEGTDVDNLRFNKVFQLEQHLEYPQNEQHYIRVGTVLRPNTYVQLQADFRGSLASLSDVKGFYKSSYQVNGETRYMASTHFEPTYARFAFPCLDEPDMKAKFSLSMVRDKHHVTLFNTPLEESSPYSDNLVRDIYAQSVKMSTYLVAFVICDFKSISNITKSGVQVRVFAPEDKIYMGEYALNAAVTVLEKYNNFFGVPYPLRKQDMIGIPNFGAGAMENWGLITYRDVSILYDPDKTTEDMKAWVATVVAHELAHQWFGNLVTIKWWNDLWLNEGFASFVEYIGADTVDKDFHMMDSFMQSFCDAMYLDSLATSHPIEVEVDNPHDIEAVFDKISYDKGASLIRMLQNVLGEATFKKGLTIYLKKHQYRNAETKDLWASLQLVSSLPSDLTVSEFMNTWTKQMNFPVVTVTRRQGKISLTQDRFLLSGKVMDDTRDGSKYVSPYGYKWIIPFTFTTSKNPSEQTLVWMKKGSASVDIPDGSLSWLKGNIGSKGFYRVNYDAASWKSIIDQLLADHTVFSVSDRVGLMEDAFSLARAGHIDYTVPLDLTKYLMKETDYFVWDTTLNHFGFLFGRLQMENEYELLKMYRLSLAKPLIDTMGWEDTGKHMEKKLQSMMISLSIGSDYQPAIDRAKGIFREWQANPNIDINKDLRPIIYYTGVKYGNKSDWDMVFERYKQAKVPSEQVLLMKALAAPCDARILQIWLKYSLDDLIVKSQDTERVVSGVSSNPSGHLIAWRFVREHWDTFYNRYSSSSFTLPSIVKAVTTSFNTQFDFDEIEAFFKGRELGAAKTALSQALEVINTHIEWTKRNLDTVKTWLKENAKQS